MMRMMACTLLLISLVTPVTAEERDNDRLTALATPHWHAVESRHPFNPAEPGSIAWSLAFTPPMPATWPLAATRGVSVYGYAHGLAPRRLADAAYIAKPLLKIEIPRAGAERVRLLRHSIEELGIQGVAPLSENEAEAAEASKRGPVFLAELTGVPEEPDPRVSVIRAYYCAWRAHNGVIAAHIQGTHGAFFDWLRCGR